MLICGFNPKSSGTHAQPSILNTPSTCFYLGDSYPCQPSCGSLEKREQHKEANAMRMALKGGSTNLFR